MPNPSIQSKVIDDRRLRVLLDGQAQSLRGAPILMKESERSALSAKKLYAGLRVFCPDSAREWLYDGTGWIIMYEPVQTFSPTVTSSSGALTTVGAKSITYQRSGGFLDFHARVEITTNGTGAGGILVTLPVASAWGVGNPGMVASGREDGVSGKALWGVVSSSGASTLIVRNYDNTYPAADGSRLLLLGRYQMGSIYS